MGKRNHLYHLKHRGNPVDGIRVELLNGSGTVISRTATVAGGQFLINADRLPEKPTAIRFLDAIPRAKYPKPITYGISVSGRGSARISSHLPKRTRASEPLTALPCLLSVASSWSRGFSRSIAAAAVLAAA